MELNAHLAAALDKLLGLFTKHDGMLADAQKAQKAAEDKLASVEADMRAAQKAAEDKAAELEAKLEALTEKVSSAIDPAPVQAAIDKIEAFTTAAEAPTAPAEPAPALDPTPAAPAAETAPMASSPVVSEAPSGAVVTVDPVVGATTHEALDGTVTTVPHDGTTPTAVNTLTGQAAEPAPAAVSEAVAASAEAGVEVPAQG